jgi:GNAT superfamily N-acetyltransferase
MIRDVGDGLQLDDDKERIDVSEVHRFLSEEAYWAIGRPRETVERLVREASRVVGLYDGDRQIGFCRAFSDGLALAYLADVYVLPAYRGRGLGEELVREMVENGPLAHVKWILHTEDMHALYRKFGFVEPSYKVLERPSTRNASESG